LQVQVQLVQDRTSRLNYWLLPGQRLPTDARAAEEDISLEPWLAPLRAQFPPSTPLDDNL
jgi:hypothetical protein